MSSVAEGFRNADSADRFAKLVRCLDFMNDLDAFKAYKSASWERLCPRSGERFLDLACGVGFDVCEMARLWPDASFVGADRSEGFLQIARERAAKLTNVEFFACEAHRLPFADGAFDGARIDRSLQHIADPAHVIAELGRVVRPGGRIVLSEPDWGAFLIDNGDAAGSQIICSKWASLFVNPEIGRRLPRYLTEIGVRIASVEAHPLVFTAYRDCEIVFDLPSAIAGCVEEGDLTAEEARIWIDKAQEATRRGDFLGLLCIVTASGTTRK
jgi:ubiquinone/menaquinone biosynthesis C-methylase UbiE